MLCDISFTTIWLQSYIINHYISLHNRSNRDDSTKKVTREYNRVIPMNCNHNMQHISQLMSQISNACLHGMEGRFVTSVSYQ